MAQSRRRQGGTEVGNRNALQWVRRLLKEDGNGFRGGDNMQNKKRDPRRWLILALINVLVIVYPVSLYCQAGDEQSTLVGACAMIGAAFLLAIADLLTIVLSFA
jgi:hypothetical protein